MSTAPSRPSGSAHQRQRLARSCEQCFSWGVLRSRLCRACEWFGARYVVGRCRTCRRPEIPIEDGVCRLCRKQATLIAGGRTAPDLSIAVVTGHQLFFADMLRSLSVTPPTAASELLRACPEPAVVSGACLRRERPLLLFDPARDCRRASSLVPPRDSQLLGLLLRHADTLAERSGWSDRTLTRVRRGLRMLAGSHDPGEPVKASTVTAMGPDVPGVRVLEVLATAGDGLLLDDRPDSLGVWIDEKFRDLPPQMRDELQAWIDVLRTGTPRQRARPRATVFTLLAAARPFLLECAGRYSTLRQVTRDDVTGWLDGRKRQANDASALRSLFRVLKAQRLVFANPTHRVRAGSPSTSTPSGLSSQALLRLGEAAERDPELRVVLALIGVHAIRPHEVRRLLLDQIDLPNRRLDVDGTHRFLDPFTAEALTEYVDYRHCRWTHTSNPHLLVNQRTSHEQCPVSNRWLDRLLRDLPATLRQLRTDRILEEARATGGDPLHLATMFGLTGRHALRYARTIHLDDAAPQNDPNPPAPDR